MRSLINSVIALLLTHSYLAFHITKYGAQVCRSTKGMQVNMLFDFFKERTQEGIDQVKNIASKTLEGKLGEALQDSATYIRERNKIDAENLKQLTLGLTRSRDRLLSGIFESFSDENADVESRLSKLEEVLLQADIGASTTSVIINDLRNYARREKLQKDDILPVLRARLVEALTPPGVNTKGINFVSPEKGGPTVLFVIGANGMGKTTTIGKIASRIRNELNMTVLLGACDTFRAAAVEQLGEWAIRANVTIEKPYDSERGGDPIPVVTRTIQRAKDEEYDVVIIDTSGRLSNNFQLTMELQGMKNAIQSVIPDAPHETLLVVDGSLGRNAVEQASAWRKYVGVSGLVITKLDGTARGGFVISVVKDLGLPIKFIGIGEKIADLRDFEAELFVDALLGNDNETTEKLKLRMNKMMNLTPTASLSSSSLSSSDSNSAASPSFSMNNGNNNDDDPAARLRASFAANGNDEDDMKFTPINMKTGGAPKRAKRPKPQPAKKKK